MNVVKMVVFVVVLVVVEGQFLTQEYQDGFIYKLNEWRRNVRNTELLVPLVWSEELKMKSLEINDGCLTNTSIKEARNSGNLANVNNGLYPVIANWYSQRFKYDIKTEKCKRRYGCSDYINLMCNKATKVGCAYVICNHTVDQKICDTAKTCYSEFDCVYGGCVNIGIPSIVCLFDQGCYKEGVEAPKPYSADQFTPKPVIRVQKTRKVPKKN